MERGDMFGVGCVYDIVMLLRVIWCIGLRVLGKKRSVFVSILQFKDTKCTCTP